MNFINPIITPRLLDHVLEGYVLNIHGIHGVGHWQQVEKNAIRLADKEGVSSDILSLFSLFHDSRRINDGRDRDHGLRGAQLARVLHAQGLFDLSGEDLDRLFYACANHTVKTWSTDPVIGICWDADRLDLPRVGIKPNPKYLNCKAAKQIAR